MFVGVERHLAGHCHIVQRKKPAGPERREWERKKKKAAAVGDERREERWVAKSLCVQVNRECICRVCG